MEFYIINKKINIATLMAQEGVIVQITDCFILKLKPKVFSKCNISAKARDRKK